MSMTTTSPRYFYLGSSPSRRITVLKDGTVKVQESQSHTLSVSLRGGADAVSAAKETLAVSEKYEDSYLVTDSLGSLIVVGWNAVDDEEIIRDSTERARKRFLDFASDLYVLSADG